MAAGRQVVQAAREGAGRLGEYIPDDFPLKPAARFLGGFEELQESIYALLETFGYEGLLSHKGTIAVDPSLPANLLESELDTGVAQKRGAWRIVAVNGPPRGEEQGVAFADLVTRADVNEQIVLLKMIQGGAVNFSHEFKVAKTMTRHDAIVPFVGSVEMEAMSRLEVEVNGANGFFKFKRQKKLLVVGDESAPYGRGWIIERELRIDGHGDAILVLVQKSPFRSYNGISQACKARFVPVCRHQEGKLVA